jgi:hypothetical protein
MIGTERPYVVAQLSGRVCRIDQHRPSRARDGRYHGGDGDDGSGRGGDPVDHDQPGTG